MSATNPKNWETCPHPVGIDARGQGISSSFKITFSIFSLRRGEVIRLERGRKLAKKSIRDVIYAPLCCKVDLSNPNKRKENHNLGRFAE